MIEEVNKKITKIKIKLKIKLKLKFKIKIKIKPTASSLIRRTLRLLN